MGAVKPLIIWDFDGVLNANVKNGRFLWADDLEADWGISVRALQAQIFVQPVLGRIMRGQVDLRDTLAAWLDQAHPQIAVDAFLSYWFTKDALPDPEVTAHLARQDFRHVIGTNNEARRAAYIEHHMGFGARVERVFSSGRMGCAKPEAAFFEQIETWSGLPSAAHILIDDSAPNVTAAQARGWSGLHLTDATRESLPAFLDQRA